MLKRLLPPGAPTWRQLPGALLHAVVFGAVVGALLSLAMGWIFAGSWARFSQHLVKSLSASAVMGAIFAVSFYATCALPAGYLRKRLAGAPRGYVSMMTAIAGFCGGTLGCVIALGAAGALYEIRTGAALGWVAAIDGLIGMGIALAVNARERRRAEAELAAARAQFRVLQSQINPHFFFNTLNTISALIPEDPDAAQRTLGLLAEMSRYAFASAETESVPLERELEFARTYLEIEKARFRSRLRFDLPDAAAAKGITLPALALQPLIENAVRHGVAGRMEGGAVAVRLWRNGEAFSLTVENPAEARADLSEGVFFRPDHALTNLRERLRIAYKGRARLEIAEPSAGTVSVTLHAPLKP
jgi:LytS/YehU family sensor histidine kinase